MTPSGGRNNAIKDITIAANKHPIPAKNFQDSLVSGLIFIFYII